MIVYRLTKEVESLKMIGRGHPGRGGSRPEYILDSFNRRGRGRPRRFPLATQPQMPSSGADQPVDEEEFRDVDEGEEEEYFEAEEVVEHAPDQDEPIREEVVTTTETEELNEEDKIKEIQQQKMMTVAPMAQKRIRGRPRRQSSSSQPQNDDFLEDDLIEQTEQSESVPIEKPGPSEISEEQPVFGRGSRVRQVPKRLNDFVSLDLPRKKVHHEEKEEEPVETSANETSKDDMDQLIPDDEHVEAMEARMQQESRQGPPAARLLPREEDLREEELEGPPPAPRHLLNRQNGRGRPANVIPPHRRPIPKDLMPPGASMILKRAGHLRDSLPAKRKDLREKTITIDDEGPPPLHPPRAPVVISDDAPPSPLPLSEVPIAIQQVEIKEEIIEEEMRPQIPMLHQVSSPEASTKKKEREAGKDLPSEHFPKEKARHVSTRGLHPFGGDKNMISYEMMQDMEQEQEETVAQQRVLTLQGGSFIEDRIGRADLMEDEEMKMMKGIQTQQYIVEENGVNVVYEVPIGAEEQVEMVESNPEQGEQYVIEDHQMQTIKEDDNTDDDDDLPPQLIPEGVPSDAIGDDSQDDDPAKETGIPLDEDGNLDFQMMQEGQTIRLQSPGGRDHEVRVARDEQGNSVFVDENGQIVELVTDSGALVDTSCMVEQGGMEQDGQVDGKTKQEMQQGEAGPSDRANIDYMNTCSFLDNNNICCGLCGEIVQYDKLVSEHLPNAHPEYTSPGIELEEVPYSSWLKTRLKQESKMMENGFRHYDEHDGAGFGGTMRLYTKGLRQMRKVSQIRVNVNEMSMQQLELALKRKLIEKMGRKVPVSLVDRLHARCDICQAVVSLNKKFEVIHLVRHFNAWHPAEHRCSQEWKEVASVTTSNSRRPLSLHDFAVVSTDTDQNNLQCIWCGMMMDRAALGMHFSEVHSQQIVVPNCSLCLQEMVTTARLMEKYGEDFGISLPDEFHLLSSKLNAKYSSEKAMDKAIDKYLKRVNKGLEHDNDDDGQDDQETICTTNSQQSFGRRNRLKRKFVKPCFRQICPQNSEFFEAKSACEWKCRLCSRAVYGAVISAGAIKHFKEFHPADIDRMQYELVKARLERIGDGSMEFVHPQLVECLICSLTYALHKPFNICRAIRHLRLKHPEVMPETAGKPISGAEIAETTNIQPKPVVKRPPIRFGEVITDPIELEKFRKENFDQQFDKIQVVYGIKKNNEPAYILLMEHEVMDHKTALEMAEKMRVEIDSVEKNTFDELVPRDEEEVIQMDQYDEPTSSQMYQDEDQKPLIMEYQEGDGDEIVEEMALEGNDETEFIQTYDANNPDHVLIEENDLITDGNYEMIQEGDYPELEDNRDVRYLTEEEIREAQARGEILEFEEEYVDAEYADQQ
ncbi:hypothetical protein CAEBREN_22153 [Caenorhabditis brenneri]|uniref:Uncharacterized protein n=1 Tax=Caenorhabditis brenneri TaxID=135651 RepID=G0NLS0_CAEBE|nr:hypothetical protein CAEBREN_22153 [Caenorhabditis brenneri]